MTAVINRLSDRNGFALRGAVDSANADRCLAQGLDQLAALAPGDCICDLSGLSTGNSVTAAVLMAWRRAAAQRQQTLTLTAIPERLKAILQASNLLIVFTPAN